MKDDQDRALRALHDVAAALNDAAEGYAKAAKAVHETDLSNRLVDLSNEREQFARELEDAIQQSGGSRRFDLHEGGILHHGWVDLEQTSRPKQKTEILQQCIDGETGTVKHFDHALSYDLRAEVRNILARQRSVILAELRSLPDAAKGHSARA
jgi:uncharacterized protein (TIGR02284 family)